MFNFIKKNSSSGLATGVEKEEKERRKREKKERKEREKRERGAMGEDLLRIDDVRRSLKLRSRRSKEKEKLPSGITADYSANFFSADIDRAKLQDEIRGGTLAVRSDTLASDSSENSLSSVSTSTTAALGGPSASSGGRPPPLPPLPPRPPKRGILKGPKVASSVHSGGSGGEDTTDDSHLLLLNTLQNEHIAYSNLPLPHPSTSKTSSHASSSSSKFNISNHHSRNPAKYITRTFIANESGEVGPARNGFGNHRDSSHREVGGASSIESLTTEDSSSFLTPPFSTSPVGEGQGFHSRFRTAAHSSEDLTLEFPLPEIRTPSLPAPRELSIGRLSPNGDFGFSLRRGMIVARSGGSYVLQGVIFAEPGLHGNDTGLLPGDRLLEVNGVGVEEKTREEIIDMIRASESAVTVKVQPVAELSELTRRSGLDGIPVELDAESIRSGTLKRSGSLRFGSSRAKSEEQLASEKAWLAAEPLWLVHRAGFTRVRPLSPLSPPPGLSSRDGKVRVQVEGSGLELTVDEDDLEKCNPAQYDTCEDICSARHLNESSVLHTLRLRYASNLIHTNAGPTAIVLNPVAPLAIYSDKVAQLFKGCSSEDTPPHIFATAQALYRSLLGTRLDHALVPMGRSGAGKTTSMQHALRYLALTADSTSKILTPDKLNAIAIVLEAFGHARTCLNLNATRVSHIFSLDFDMTGAIASASIQLLLLDKQRVVRRSEGESNFHVFYRLLSGADSTLRKELMLDAITGGGEANQFITPYAKHEDKQRGLMDFVRLCAALTTLGTTEAELKAVFSLLAAVLHLGAAGAVKGSSGAAGKWQFQSPGAASRAAKVLGLAPDSLARALFSPQGPAGGGSPGSPGGGGTLGRRTAGSSPGGGGGRIEEASGQEMVESFAMNLYAEAFNSVGGLINRSLASSSHSVCSLLLVDTPGFQNPASTGLNQLGAGFSDLCFNYLQERLSLLFHHSSLVTPKDLYSQEHIDIPGLDLSDPDDEFSSPSALVSLLDNSPSPGPAYNSLGPAHSQDRKPPGLLWLLDELTSGGVGSASSPPPTFPDLVFGNFSEKEYHGLLRKAPGAHHFIVQHNLGTNPVLYNSEGWARQLREPSTPRALLALLSESTHKQLAALVGSSRGGGLSGGTYDLGAGGTVRGVTSLRRTATGGFAKRRSVPVQVKSAVDSLIETIRRTHLQFAHCLLPHHHAGLVDTRSLAPTAAPFDSLVNVPLLRSQLRGAQLLPAARLHKQGYPHHLPLAEFRRRYALLAAPPDSATDSSETPRADSATQPPPPPADDRGAVEEILLSLDLDASSYRVGLSQIFFRSHVLPQLEAERDKKLSSRVIAFQAQCRGYLARKHLAKLKVQDVAVRCIQRNVRKSLQVRDWSWWRLYLKIHPILNVHRTDQELKAKTEELEALKSKLEKLEVERNILKQDNTRLESKLGEITEDYADEHSTATLATERLHIESAERARLERELAEAQSANKRLAETSDKLEAEMQCLRSTDALSLEAEEESGGGSEGDVVYRKKWERAMRELELAKHRLSTQHQDDLEQMVGLRKQLEKKIADAHEQTEEQRQVAAEWKRKQTRLSSELADTRLLLEEQSSRNNLLEKKQRKFDAEFSLLQDELRQERNLKEKAMRDKELALGDKYTMEQSMSSLKLELELKDTKLAGLASELEELQFSSNTEEEVAALKKKKHALEARLKDQEEELDELAGQVQMLEQAKLKVEMSLEQMRKAHRKELSCKDEELEALRCSTQKKVKALQSQLESEHDSRSSLLRERHEMERRLSALADQGVATQAADAETMQRLKRDLKRTKALLKDTQTMLAQARQDNPNRLLLRQLRNQLEDAELARSVATKARLSLESDLADLTLSLEETSRAKGELEARLSEALRERSSLQSTLDENEEEMTEVLKKYQASVAQLSSEQAQLQEAATRVAELETDNAALKEQLADLSGRLESIEAHGDPSSTLALKRLMLKGKELESKLEFEHTTRSRLEVQISRLKETSDKLQAECNLLRGKDNSHSQEARRLQRSIRELKETVQGLEARGVNEALKRKELEKEVQCREAEIASLKNELSVSSQRIQDLQHAIQGDLDDEYDDEDDSDASSDQDQDISSDDEDYTSHQEDEVYTSKDTLRSCSDAGR